MEGWIYLLIFGAIVGWIAGLLMKGSGYGLFGNIILGVIGSLVGGWLFDQLGVSIRGDWVGSLIKGVSGAAIVIFLARLIRK